MYQETYKQLFSESPMYIRFRNDTDLPLSISSWVKGSNTMSSCRVGPRVDVLLHSSVGEWHMDTMFDSDEDRKPWIDAGLEKYLIIGKFRSSPCARGDYSWMEYYEPFECVYAEDKSENVAGLIVFRFIDNNLNKEKP